VESKVTVCHEVSCDFFKSIVGSLHGCENLHFESILGSVESGIINWGFHVVEFFGKDLHKFLRVGSWTFDGKSEKTRVREVDVNWVGSINEVVLLHN